MIGRETPRRRLLTNGAALTTAVLAGCTNETHTAPDDNMGSWTAPEEGSTNHPKPQIPAAYFSDTGRSEEKTGPDTTYTLGDLEPARSKDAWIEYRNSGVSTATIDDQTLEITIPDAYLNRPITIVSRIQSQAQDDTIEFEETIEPRHNNGNLTDEDSYLSVHEPPLDDFQSINLSFTISNPLPRNIGTAVSIWVKDSLFSDWTSPPEYLLGNIYMMQISHNSETLLTRTQLPEHLPQRNLNYNTDSTGRTQLFVEGTTVDERTSYWGLSHTIPRNEYKEVTNHPDWKANDPTFCFEQVNNAPNTHFATLAETIHDILTSVNITDPYPRLNSIHKIVNTLKYKYKNSWGHTPTEALWNGHADCGEAAYIFNSILNCSPFNYRTSHIYCEINGDPHLVSGIDVRDAPQEAIDNLNTFAPIDQDIDEGIPDTEYVITDPSASGPLGQGRADSYTFHNVSQTSELDRQPVR